MSQDIVREVYFLLGSILMGIIITFAYDFILILRRLIRHKAFFVSIEDFLFWAACAIAVFYMLYKENDGILRWFAVTGAAAGMFLYKWIIGKHFVHIASMLIQKELHLICKVISVIVKPFKFLFTKIKKIVLFFIKIAKKTGKFFKKKLTVFIKLFKITLCKH